MKNAFVGLEQFKFIFEREVFMKMFRKVVAIVLGSLMCCCVSVQSVASASEAAAATSEQALTYEGALNNAAGEFIDEYPNYSEQINEKLNIFLQDSELERLFNDAPDDALVIFNRAIEIDIEISSDNGIAPCMSAPVGNGLGTIYYCTVDASIVQENNNWCGAGSTQMALTGIETYNRNTLISGYTRPTQSQIAPYIMDNTSIGESYPGSMTQYLNSKLTANEYTCEPITASTTKNDVKEYIINSLINNRPVILNALPYYTFSYYSDWSGLNTGHYLVVEDYNSYTDTYTVVDCTYLEDYHGRHTQITIDEIYNSVKYSSGASWRYVIHG